MSDMVTAVPAMPTLEALREAAARSPASARAHYELGTALLGRGEHAEAIACLRAAIALEPDAAACHVGLGIAHVRTGAFEQAAEDFLTACRLDPDSRQAAVWLATVCTQHLARHARAREACLMCIRAHPSEQTAYELLCRVCLEGFDAELGGALRWIDRELPAGSRREYVPFAIAKALTELGRYEEARDSLAARVDAGRGDAAMLALLARIEHTLGDGAASQARFARLSTQLDDHFAFDEYVRYLWRRGRYAEMKQVLQQAAREDGRGGAASIEGRFLLLGNSTVNGFGDEVQWAVVGQLLQTMGARVLIECRSPLRRLLSTMRGIDGVIVRHDPPPPHYERHTIFRLLASVDWTWERLGRDVPYVHVPPAMQREWRAKVETFGRGLHVGVEWRATDGADRDPHTKRTMPAACLAPLMAAPGVIWHSLHVGGDGQRELDACVPRLPIAPLSEGVGDFLDTAAMVSAVDVVVTVDTAIAHVAGAVGKPTFLLLPSYPEWRWGDDDCPGPWYPSIERYRQRAPGDWASIVDALAHRLSSCTLHSPS